MTPAIPLSSNSPYQKKPADSRLIAALAAALSASVFLGWLGMQVVQGDTLRFDLHIRMLLHQFASPGLTTVMRIFTTIGESPVLFALAIGLAAVMWRLKWERGTTTLLIAMAGAAVLDYSLKLGFHRARPAPFFGTPVPNSYSFPSGHALFSVCLFGVLAALITARSPSVVFRVAVWMLAVVVAGMIGLSRIYLGVHYPSDVIGGYAAGFIWLMMVAVINGVSQRRRRTANDRGGPPRRPE